MVQFPELGSLSLEAQDLQPAGAPRHCQPRGYFLAGGEEKSRQQTSPIQTGPKAQRTRNLFSLSNLSRSDASSQCAGLPQGRASTHFQYNHT